MRSWRWLSLVFTHQRPALRREWQYWVYISSCPRVSCVMNSWSHSLSEYLKNRRKADISIFILHIGKQNEEKSRDFKMFSLLPFTAFAVLFSGNVFSPLSFPLKLLFILLNQLFAGTCPLLCALTAIPVFSVVQYLSYFAVINHWYVFNFQKYISL